MKRLVLAALLIATLPVATAHAAASLCGKHLTHSITLKADLDCSGDGLIIAASGVAVHLNNHTISGDGTGRGITNLIGATYKHLHGINITGQGIITNFGTDLDVQNVSRSSVSNITFTHSSENAFIVIGSRNKVSDLIATSNFAGMYLSGSHNSARRLTSIGNGGQGIVIVGDHDTVRYSISEYNANNGFDLTATFFDLLGNIASHNTQSGIASHDQDSGSTLSWTTANNNAANGIDAVNATGVNNEATGNGGIDCTTGSPC
jgi:hypothetical protein